MGPLLSNKIVGSASYSEHHCTAFLSSMSFSLQEQQRQLQASPAFVEGWLACFAAAALVALLSV